MWQKVGRETKKQKTEKRLTVNVCIITIPGPITTLKYFKLDSNPLHHTANSLNLRPVISTCRHSNGMQ
jgi:hypothetical protein